MSDSDLIATAGRKAPCAHNTMTPHTQTLATTFTNYFCAYQLPPFTEFRTWMDRHIAFAVIKHLSNLYLKNKKACNCDNLRKLFYSFYFPFLLLFISHLIKKLGKKLHYVCLEFHFHMKEYSIMQHLGYMQAMCLHIKVAELNTPSDGNGAYHH